MLGDGPFTATADPIPTPPSSRSLSNLLEMSSSLLLSFPISKRTSVCSRLVSDKSVVFVDESCEAGASVGAGAGAGGGGGGGC